MKNIKYILSFWFSVLLWYTNAQQDQLTSLYMFDKLPVNPAYAGSSPWLVGTIKYREQFRGMQGRPAAQTLNIHSPIQRYHLGLGARIVNEKIALLSNLQVAGIVSYHLNFAGGKLSAGMEFGGIHKRIDHSKLYFSSRQDEAIARIPMSAWAPDLSAGLYYQKKQSYAGLSLYHLLRQSINYNTALRSDSRLYRHLYLIAGHHADLNKLWSTEISSLVRYQKAAGMNADINMTLFYKQKLGTGVQIRTEKAFVSFIRYHISENFRIAYAYDHYFSSLAPYAGGSHEIVLSYGVKLPPPPMKNEVHPRYYF